MWMDVQWFLGCLTALTLPNPSYPSCLAPPVPASLPGSTRILQQRRRVAQDCEAKQSQFTSHGCSSFLLQDILSQGKR